MIFQAFILGFIAIFIGISNSAGIGGGTIINVLLILGMGYTAKQSIIISYIFLMGGGLAATIASAKKFTASGKRFIDYDLVMITLPMMMSGAIIGVMVNHLISQLVITIIFTILIGNIMYTSYSRMQQETAIVKDQSVKFISDNTTDQSQQYKVRLSEIITEEKALVPLDKIFIIFQIYVYTVIIVLFKGGQSFNSIIGLESCGVGSYILVAVHVLLSYFYCRYIASKQMQRDNQKEKLGYVFSNQGEKMSPQKMRKGMFNGLISGVLGATVAIGGGLILIPIWLKAGIEKEVVTSSTAPLIFFSASVSFLMSAVLGHYHSVWQVFLYLALSFVGSFVIKKVIMHFTAKYGLKKLIYILLLILTSLSLGVFLPLQFFKLRENSEQFLAFDCFC